MASYDDYLQYLKIVDDRTLEELHVKEKELQAHIAALQKSHQEEIQQLKSVFQAKMVELKTQCKDELEKKVAEDRNVLQALKDEAAAQIASYKTSVSELKAKCQSVSKDAKALKAQNAQLIKSKSELEAEVRVLDACRQRYKKALIWVCSSAAVVITSLIIAICI